ncbi:MAG TPA: IPT/TIG domain-containing protein, partial [Terriglobales bacterium]|nr:IPT/TIG domain-containing protein [Terriglobales bacterium]
NAATPQSATSTVSVSYPLQQTAGDLNVVVVGWNDTTSAVQSVKDSAGNVYSLAAGPSKGNGITQAIYYAKNIAASISNAVTVTFNQAASYPDVRILEYQGLNTANPLDVTSSATGTGTAANSGSATTTAANELIFGANTVATGNLGPGPAFTQRIITTPDSDLAEDRAVTIAGSYNASSTLTGSGNWVMQMVTFKQAVAGGSTAPSVTSVSPASGSTSGGTAVTISGANFAAGDTVSFGGTAASNVSVVNSTTINAATPAHAAGAVNVVVTSSGGQSGTLNNGFTYTSSAVSIGFVQVAAATPQSPTASVTVAYPGAQTAGNLNVVVVGWNDTTSTVQSVSDSAGNTYSLAAGPTSGTGITQSLYYAKSIAGGNNKVTVTFNQAASYPDVRVLEYTGLDSSSPLDVTAVGTGNSSSASSASATTTSGNELIFGANTVGTGNKAPGTGFTTRIITTPDSDLAEDETVSATGSYAATATLTSKGPWVMQMAAFKAAGASTASPPTVTGIAPSSGPATGGTAVTLTGTNFVSGATVSFGGTAASNVNVTSSTTLTATTPAHSAGVVNVVVTDPNGLSGTLSNGYTYTASVSTISFVQVASATPQTATATVSVAFTKAQTAGNLNIVVVGWNDTTSTVSSVTDSLGNAYTLAVGPTVGTGITQSIYYAKNIAAGSNTVKVTFSQSASYVDVRILEYSGLDTANPLQVSAGASGKSATASSGAVTTSSASTLIFGANTVATWNTGPGAGFTSRIITSPDGDIAEDDMVTATGTYTATATLGASGNWVMQVAAFKAAGQ